MGFSLAKFKQPFDNKMVTSVMANVGYPTLILSHLLGHSVDLPVSAATYLWVEMYRPKEAPDVAGLILVTTLLTIIVLPLALTYWI